MAELQIVSVAEPFSAQPTLAGLALRLLTRAEFMSCLPAGGGRLTLDAEAVRAVAKCLAQAGIPTSRWTVLDGSDGAAASWQEALSAINEQLEMSPHPDGEWPPVIAMLGEELVAELLGISVSSARRYLAGTRSTPQEVAERLHFVAMLLADLAGSYNDYGVRRWFTRPRSALHGKSPLEALGAGFDPDGPPAQQVRRLAAGLVAAGAA